MPAQAMTAETVGTKRESSFSVDVGGEVVLGDRVCFSERVWAETRHVEPAVSARVRAARAREHMQMAFGQHPPSRGRWELVGTRTISGDILTLSEEAVSIHVLTCRVSAPPSAGVRPGTLLEKTRSELAEANAMRDPWEDEAGRWSREEELNAE
jgi:hypothetical protein